jgi:flagella basal body P-ring formation protein FlgA
MSHLLTALSLCLALGGAPSNQNVARDMVRAEIENVLGPQLELRKVEVPKRLRLGADGDLRIRWDRAPKAGKSWVTVLFKRRGSDKEQAALVRVELAERKPVVVLRRPVEAGAVITAEDVGPAYRAADEALELLPAALVGATARTKLGMGHVLRGGDVDLPPPIARGTVVSVTVRAPGLVVTTGGRLERTARPGESVAVRVEATKRVLQGHLQSGGVVLVEGAN